MTDISDPDSVVAEAKRFLQTCLSSEDDLRLQAEEDLKFAFASESSDQWDENTLKERGNRPCLTFNVLGQAVDQVVNDQRLSRPAIKVHPVDEESDPALADVYNGLIYNIEALSDAESVYDDAFQYAVTGGFGYWRILPEYESDKSFNQCIYIRPVESQFSVYMDGKHPTKMDAKRGLLSVWMSKSAFRDEYGDDAMVAFDELESSSEQWIDDDQIRVAEYYRRVPTKRTLIELSDGRVNFKDEWSEILDELEADGIKITREREVEVHQIEWFKLSGASVLEGPITYNCSFIPIVRVIGKRIIIGNKERIKGMVRDAKDGQRSYNYMRSDLAEDVLMRPKAPVFLSDSTVEEESYRKIWKNAHKALFNFLPFKSDPMAPGGGAPIPNTSTGLDAGKLAIAQQDLEDIKRTTGHFEPSLGEGGNQGRMSGVALRGWQDRAGIGAFVYHDNLAKAIQQTGRILVDLIPEIYDTERVVRILGRDGTEEFVRINSQNTNQDGNIRSVGKIANAKFDVTIDTGPSYTTQRQEAADKILELGKAWPVVYELASDIIAKGIDIPNQDDFVRRLRKRLITQGVIEPNMEDPEESKIAQQMSQQNPAMDQLITAQAEEASTAAAENVASIEQKRAQALKMTQDAIGQMLENMIQQRKLRVDPDGLIQMMTEAAIKGSTGP